MAITDLTGTKWILKSSVYITQNISYSVDCSYDGYDFETIDFRYYTIDGKTWKSLWLDGYEMITATVQDNPVDNLYSNQILEITGGTDATNPDLITWLAQNATLQEEPEPVGPTVGTFPIVSAYLGSLDIEKIYIGQELIYEKAEEPGITDLTGTNWIFNQQPSPKSVGTEISYNINFTSNNETYSQLSEKFVFGGDWGLAYGNLAVHDFTTKYWTDEPYRRIVISGGTDATNADLIAWLQENATLITAELISFSIQKPLTTTTYQAEAGMTWEQFVNSPYNIPLLEIIGPDVTSTGGGMQLCISGGPAVSPSDEIISNGVYAFSGGGSN